MEMKKVFTMMTALSLLAVLAGCGSSGSDGGPADSLPLTEVRSAQLDESLTLSAEWPSYDSLDATVYVVLENHGDETVTTGADFQLERDMGGGGEFSWYQLELKENVGWTAIEFVIPPGESMAFACPLSVCETSFLTGGHFRIVKETGGNRCAAEFTVSDDAPVSEQRPYGFAALEELPADYGTEDAIADGCVVFRDGETPANAEKLGLFFEKVRLGIPCQLRTVRLTAEGAPVLEDVVYESISGAGGRFFWRRDDSRDALDAVPGIGPVFYYSYLQTDGRRIALSNAVEWDRSYGEPNLELLAGEEAAPYLAAVEEMTRAALEDNITRYRVWSADGTRYACLTEDPLEFAWGDAGYGAVHSLADYDGLDDAIEHIRWADGHTLELTVRQLAGPEGDTPAVIYLWDTETSRLTGTDAVYCVPSVVDPRDL